MKYISSNTKRIIDIDFDNTKKRCICPECTDGRKKTKNKDLEFHPESNSAYCWHCNTSFHEYKPYQTEKKYTVPEWQNKTDLSDKAVKWFQSRMISQSTLIKLKIHSLIEWMPQFNGKVECICFPFFRFGKLANIKYRGPQKSFKLVSNAELIWYNFDAIQNNTEIYICEGEIDALTFIENGFENVISVPNGAKSKSEYLDNSIHLFEKVEKIYLSTDNDSPGLELRDELIRRFGAEKCYTINFRECKDANEFFCKYGGIEFKESVLKPIPIPIAGNIEIGSMYSEILDLYENGIKPGQKIEVNEVDQFCTWELGRLCTVTGVPSSGKSEFVDYIVTRLNLLYGWKVAYFTPENYPLKFHYAKIHEKITGQKFKKYGDNTDFETTFEYIKDNFFYVLNEKDLSVESVLKCAQSFVKSKGIKIFVVDPYNKLDHQIRKTENETQYISRFLDMMVNFAHFNNVLLFLVAHPRKLQNNDVPTLYDISGSANFYNKTDYGFTVHRERDSLTNSMLDAVQVHWQKIRFKHLGKQGVSMLNYDLINGRFFADKKADSLPWLNNIMKNNSMPVNGDFGQDLSNDIYRNYNSESKFEPSESPF